VQLPFCRLSLPEYFETALLNALCVSSVFSVVSLCVTYWREMTIMLLVERRDAPGRPASHSPPAWGRMTDTTGASMWEPSWSIAD